MCFQETKVEVIKEATVRSEWGRRWDKYEALPAIGSVWGNLRDERKLEVMKLRKGEFTIAI